MRNFIQDHEDVDQLPRNHVAGTSLVNMMWKARQVREMGRIIPTPDQIPGDVSPVITVSDYVDLAVIRALEIFGKLEETVVGQGQPGTQMAISQCRSFLEHLKTNDQRVSQQTRLDRLQVFGNGHN